MRINPVGLNRVAVCRDAMGIVRRGERARRRLLTVVQERTGRCGEQRHADGGVGAANLDAETAATDNAADRTGVRCPKSETTERPRS